MSSIFFDRPADSAAELLNFEIGLGAERSDHFGVACRGRGNSIVAGARPYVSSRLDAEVSFAGAVVAHEIEAVAVKIISSGLTDDIDHATGGAAKLGRVGIRQDLKFLN